jgi:hypothetical protein
MSGQSNSESNMRQTEVNLIKAIFCDFALWGGFVIFFSFECLHDAKIFKQFYQTIRETW